MKEIPMLIKRCLAFGVQIFPYELNGVLSSYERYQIPDDRLSKLNGADLKKYVNALYLASCEMAQDWTKGHALLQQLGFKEQRREEGHRTFVSMVYDDVIE